MNINWNKSSILSFAARNSIGQVNVTRIASALQKHSDAIGECRLKLWWDVHVGRDSGGNNLSLLKLRTHSALQEAENIYSVRMLLSDVSTNSRDCAAGNKHRSKRMKCSVSLDHLLGKAGAIIQKLLKLVRVYGECGHA